MAYVIKDTVDIYCFCNNWYETAQEHLLFKLPQVSWNKSKSSYIFLSKLLEISLIQNPDPRAKKVGRKPNPRGSENVRIPEARPGGWSGLELTDI